MATNTPTLFYRGAATTTSTNIYTVPSATTSILTDIVVSSTDSNQQTVTIYVDGVVLIPTVPVPSNSVLNFQFRTVMGAGKTITALAGSTNVFLHVSGVQSA
jgi:hypothetical protein